jgi:cell division protein ZapA
MAGRTVELSIAGETVRVVTTAEDGELARLAGIVEEKLAALSPPGRPPSAKVLVLVAMALAHDLEQQRARADEIARKARDSLRTMLSRVDGALEQSESLGRDREARRKQRRAGPASERSSPGSLPNGGSIVDAWTSGDDLGDPP